MPCACDVCRLFAGKIRDFFMQPVTVRGFAADLLVITKVLAILAFRIVFAAHLPSLAFVGMGIWALSNGRFFSMGFAFMCAYAWTKWLWSFIPV